MICTTEVIEQLDSGKYLHRCTACGREGRYRSDNPARVKQECYAALTEPRSPLLPQETAALFPNEAPTLLGNRIAALTAAIGIPPCGGCNKRKKWLNKAHAWLRAIAAPASDS